MAPAITLKDLIKADATAPVAILQPARTKNFGVKNAKAINAVYIQELGFPTPLEYLVRIYGDENIPRSERTGAAIAAAPYVHAKLNAIDVNANIHVSHEDALALLDTVDEDE